MVHWDVSLSVLFSTCCFVTFKVYLPYVWLFLIHRQSYAQHISILAETALRFLNSSNYDQNSSYMSTGTSYQPSYDFQLQNLYKIVQVRRVFFKQLAVGV